MAGILVLSLLYSCQTASFVWHGSEDQAVMLASGKTICKPEYEKRIWSALFGALPINSLDNKAYFKNPEASYRITNSMHWSDLAITVFGGWLLSVTTRTWLVETCESEYQLVSATQSKRQNEQALLAYSQHNGSQLVVFAKDDKKWQGKLLAIDKNNWVLEVESKEDVDADAEKLDVLELKSGKNLTGQVLSQSKNSVRFRSAVGTKRYLKSTIKKIRFKAIESVVSKKKININKDDIQKVLFN